MFAFFKKKKSVKDDSKTPAPKKSSPYEKAIDWEAQKESVQQKSEAKAWRLCSLLTLIVIALVAAICVMLPLKKTEPFLIKVNESTGEATVLSIANVKDIPWSEAMDKYWLNQYVLARESYHYRTLSHEFNVVRLLSFPEVFDPYASQFGDNANSLELRLKDNQRIYTDILSIIPRGEDNEGNKVATVRFTKRLTDTKSGEELNRQTWNATISFEYLPNFAVEEPERLINPFGFKVTSYRVDPEISGAKP